MEKRMAELNALSALFTSHSALFTQHSALAPCS